MNAPNTSHAVPDVERGPWHAHTHARHPLELLPWFRRWQPSRLRSYVYTAIVCCAVVAVIVAVNAVLGNTPSANQWGAYLIIALCIGVCQQFVFDLFGVIVQRFSVKRRAVFIAISAVVAPVLGLYGGFFIAALILGGGPWYGWLLSRNTLIGNSVVVIAVAFFIGYSTTNNEKLQAAKLAEAHAAASAEAAQRETMHAELKALRAQVEPHFLYNTLANVVSLIDRDPPQAKRMAERLIGYLRHTLDASRRDHATVGDELAIITDYLEILRLRMGERLTYSIVANDAVRAWSLPPMLLQPLVENAVKHGLEPKIEGGHVAIAALLEDAQLLVTINDTGLGFGASPDTAGSGSGLANVRARLAAVYGTEARLTIELASSKDGGGTRISIRVPRESTR
jgi:signal transduction histidine kinase